MEMQSFASLRSTPPGPKASTPQGSKASTPQHLEMAELVLQKLRKIAKDPSDKETLPKKLLVLIGSLCALLNDSKDSLSLQMPAKLQEAMVIYMMSKKSAGDLRITEQDISQAFADLKEMAEKEENTIVNAISHFSISDPRLLAVGIEMYNQDFGKEAPVHTMVSTFGNEDLYGQLLPYLPLSAIHGLSQTCTSFRQVEHSDSSFRLKLNDENSVSREKSETWEDKFSKTEQRPERYLPYDQHGAELSKKYDFDQSTIRKTREGTLTLTEAKLDLTSPGWKAKFGPLTIGKIRYGQLTLEQAKEQLKRIESEIKARIAEGDRAVADYLRKDFIQKHIMDGSLALTGPQFDEELKSFKANKLVHDCVKHKQYCKNYIIQISSDGDAFIQFIHNRTLGGMEFHNLTEYVDHGILTPQYLFNLTNHQVSILMNPMVYHSIKTNKLTVEEAFQFPREKEDLLKEPYIAKFIKYGVLTLLEVCQLTDEQLSILGELPHYSNSGYLKIERALTLTQEQASFLRKAIFVTRNKNQKQWPSLEQLLWIGEKSDKFNAVSRLYDHTYGPGGWLPLNTIVTLSDGVLGMLSRSEVIQLVHDKKVTVDDIINKTWNARIELVQAGILPFY